jgi:hypothetical protein
LKDNYKNGLIKKKNEIILDLEFLFGASLELEPQLEK